MQWLVLCLVVISGYRFNKIAHIPKTEPWYHIYTGDLNHNGLDEIIFDDGAIYEYIPINQYQFVHRVNRPDTSIIITDIGESDNDSLSELFVYFSVRREGKPTWKAGAILESENFNSFPYTTVWWDSTISILKSLDLDNDEKMELFTIWYWREYIHWRIEGIKIYESQGNNNFIPVFSDSIYVPGPYVFGDFDGDGKREWFAASGSSNRIPENAIIFECDGDNSFKLVWKEWHDFINLHDSWLGNDTDGDGKKEIFVKPYWFGPNPRSALAMYEATRDNSYQLKVIDTILGSSVESESTCGDVDGDGIEEVVVSLGTKIMIYKATGDDKYEKVCEWRNDIGEFPHEQAIILCHDFNKNGYDEIVIAGNVETAVFELDTAYGIASNPQISQFSNLSISPNPFKAVVNIKWQVVSKGPISLEVYDASGRLVKNLPRARSPGPRAYTTVWDGRNDKGKEVPSGIYFCSLKTGDFSRIEKLILIR